MGCHKTSSVADSGASLHVTSRKEFFTSCTPDNFNVLKMDNVGLLKFVSIGNVLLVTNNGTTLVLKDERHMSNVWLNFDVGREG